MGIVLNLFVDQSYLIIPLHVIFIYGYSNPGLQKIRFSKHNSKFLRETYDIVMK